MKKVKLISIFLFLLLLKSCVNNDPPINIQGLWISNDETSKHSLSGTQKSVFHFDQNQSGEWGVQGVFLWNGDRWSEWEISNFRYDKLEQTIEFIDGDGDIFKGIFDQHKKSITFSIYFTDAKSDRPSDLLVLVPADKGLENRLLYPRMKDNSGLIIYTYQQPEQLDDGLQTASIYHSAINPDSIFSLMNRIIDQEYGRLESLLIIKDGKLVVEEYFYGYDKIQTHKIFSCTKSVTSVLLGIALDHHKNISVDQTIFSFFPEYDSLNSKEKDQIELKHALTMTAGLQWDECPKEMFELENRIAYVLSLRLEAKPGEKFLYNSGLSVLFGGIIAQLEGEDVGDFADRYFFNPLGITDYEWRRHKNGELELWNGLMLRPRDMAKIGLLVLNNGMWQGKQIVSEDWLTESTKPHTSESAYFDYGFQWWLRTKSTKQWWKEPNSTDVHDMVAAFGFGGQFIIVVRDLNLVIVTSGSNFNNDLQMNTFPMVAEEIIPAITDGK